MLYFHLYEQGLDYAHFLIPCEVLPRVGETFEFSFAAYDRELWDQEEYANRKELDRTVWEILSIKHSFRQNSVRSWGSHIIAVTAKRLES